MPATTVAVQLGPRIGVASLLILLALPIITSFLPWVDAIEPAPAIVFEMTLPPLLFGVATSIPAIDFRRDLTVVLGLAISLITLSALVLGFTIHALIPAITLPWTVASGTTLSLTDMVTILIVRSRGASHRIITVLEDEGLFNNAIAPALLSATTPSVLRAKEHALAPLDLDINFLITPAITILADLLVEELGMRICAKITGPVTDAVFSFAMPLSASVLAEHLEGLGLAAAIVVELVVSHR